MNNLPASGALKGITVLDLSRLLPGPYCSMILADHGARVIMIEDRRFESESGFPEIVMRNKEHMCLNLKSEEGRDVFFRLVEKADVVLEGFRPGIVRKLGVDYESVKAVNPAIIYCSITGYGQTGPLKDRPGHDVNYVGESGLLSLVGKPDEPPSIPGFQVADLAGGGMNGVIGILLALHARSRTGTGQYIDISMTDGCTALLSLALDFRQITGQPVVRSDSILSHRYAFYNTYETADGKYISIGCLEFRFWKTFCEFLNKNEWIGHQYDDNRKDDIILAIRQIFKEKSLAEWEKSLEGWDICWGKVNTLDDALESRLLNDRQMVFSYTTHKGEQRKTLGLPVKLSGTPGSIRTPPALFGKDTELILSEFGYSQDEISNMQSTGVL